MGCGGSKAPPASAAEPPAKKDEPTAAPPAAAATPAAAPAPPAPDAAAPAVNGIDVVNGMMEAWGKGEFAELSNPAWEKFLAADFVWDASIPAPLNSEVFREYKGHEDFKVWLDRFVDLDMSGMTIGVVDGPKCKPGSVVMKVTATPASKTNGHASPGPITDLMVWSINADGKVCHGKGYFGAPDCLLYVIDADFPKPCRQPAMPVPEGVSKEKALELFAKMYGDWGTGKFNMPDTKEAAMKESWAEDFVFDCTAPGLGASNQHPGIFRLYHGHAGGEVWVCTVIPMWEMKDMDMDLSGLCASPTEGAAIHFFKHTSTHKETGKSFTGLNLVEWFYNSEGLCTGGKFYWGDLQAYQDTWPAAEEVPPAVNAFFDGEPLAGKLEAMPGLMADDFECAFVGPYTGATTGVKMDKEKLLGAGASLVKSFPDFTFNTTKVKPTKGVDGGWWTMMQVSGTFTGEPFTPMPDKLPAIDKTDAPWMIGPEVFTVYPSEDGTQIKKITIEPQYKGALNGPPGIYVACGGKLPGM